MMLSRTITDGYESVTIFLFTIWKSRLGERERIAIRVDICLLLTYHQQQASIVEVAPV